MNGEWGPAGQTTEAKSGGEKMKMAVLRAARARPRSYSVGRAGQQLRSCYDTRPLPERASSTLVCVLFFSFWFPVTAADLAMCVIVGGPVGCSTPLPLPPPLNSYFAGRKAWQDGFAAGRAVRGGEPPHEHRGGEDRPREDAR